MHLTLNVYKTSGSEQNVSMQANSHEGRFVTIWSCGSEFLTGCFIFHYNFLHKFYQKQADSEYCNMYIILKSN